MRRVYARLLFAGSLLLAALPAHADGSVARAAGCGERIFTASQTGYSVLVAAAPGQVADGDLLTGDLDRIGHVMLLDQNSGRTISAQVEEHGLDKNELAQRIAVHCRSLLANSFVSGRVERSEGCGNKILVDTPKGYAVLERIGGGIANTGDTLTGNFNKAGRASVQDVQTGAMITVFVDDFQISRSAFQRYIDRNCRR